MSTAGAALISDRYIGCVIDDTDRDMNELILESNDMTIIKCITLCKDASYKYAGLQVC